MRPDQIATLKHIMAKILVIDDSESVLAFMESVLRRESHEVLSTLSGAEALQILRKERVDLVITDSYLPPPDGLDDWPGDNP